MIATKTSSERRSARAKARGGRATDPSRDLYRLYQESVQNPQAEVSIMRRVFRRRRHREPLHLREDFCGTAFLSYTWVRTVPDGRAVAIDLDPVPLEYAREVNVEIARKKADRVELVRGDVLEVERDPADVVAAYNFSYLVFKERSVLAKYFSRVRDSLVDDGVFFLDIYGGPEAQAVQAEPTEHDDFTYIWDQAAYNPITGDTVCHIHFEFPDGSKLERAFTYHWRLWSLPEIRDLLREAGFRDVEVLWEGTDEETEGGNGVFRPSLKGDNSVAWIAYIVAFK